MTGVDFSNKKLGEVELYKMFFLGIALLYFDVFSPFALEAS